MACGAGVADAPGPLAVVSAWGSAGARAVAILAAGVAVAGLARLALRSARTPRVAVFAAATLASACALAAPAVFSSDVYAYALYGERAAHGQNPYLPARIDRANPLERAVARQWGDPPPRAVYGPLFVAIAALVDLVQRGAPASTLWGLRILAVVGTAAGAIALDRLRRGAGAAFVLNPVVLWSGAEGHNDALALALVAGGASARSATVRAGLTVAAAWTKATALVPAVVALARPPRTGVPVLAVIAGALGYLPLLLSVHDARPQSGAFARVSATQTVATLLERAAAPSWLAWTLAAAGSVLVVAVLLDAARRAQASGTAGAWSAIGLAAWFAAPNVYPWYTVWLAAAGSLEAPSPLARAATVATFASLVRYLPDAVNPAHVPADPLVGVGIFLPPALAVAFAHRKLR